MGFSRPEYWGGLLLLLSRFSCIKLCAIPQTAAHQDPPSLGFSRQEYWSRVPLPSPTGVDSLSLLQGIFLTQELNWGLLHCRRILYRRGHQGRAHQSEPHFTAPFGQLAPSQGLAGTRTEEQLGSLPAGTPASPPRVLDSLPLGALVFCGFKCFHRISHVFLEIRV